MNKAILQRLLRQSFFSLLFIIFFVFLPSFTIHYYEGGIFFFAHQLILVINAIMAKNYADAPKIEEGIKMQKFTIMTTSLASITVGLEKHGIKLIPLPRYCTYLGLLLFFAGLFACLYTYKTMRLSFTILELGKKDKNIKGTENWIFQIVRFPGNSFRFIAYLGYLLIGRSKLALIFSIAYIILILRKTMGDDEILKKESKEYEDYAKRVKCRLIPLLC